MRGKTATLGHDLILSILALSEYSHRASASDLTILRKAKVALEAYDKTCVVVQSDAVA